jgi:hypothetical protein
LLERTDVHPLVIEPTAALGGIARTHVHNGNRIDIGGHRFLSTSERVMKWWFSMLPPQSAPAADDIAQEHAVDLATEVVLRVLAPKFAVSRGEPASPRDLPAHPATTSGFALALAGSGPSQVLEVRRAAPDPEREDRVMLRRSHLSRIYFARYFFPYPLRITLLVAWRLGLVNTALITLSYLWAKVFPRRDETFLDAFFINRFGRRLYETFFRGYTEKVWGVKLFFRPLSRLFSLELGATTWVPRPSTGEERIVAPSIRWPRKIA